MQVKRGITCAFSAFMFFQPLIHVCSQKSGRKVSSSVYFRFFSAMYATTPMMHAATTAITIASSVDISGISDAVCGSGSPDVGSSGVV